MTNVQPIAQVFVSYIKSPEGIFKLLRDYSYEELRDEAARILSVDPAALEQHPTIIILCSHYLIIVLFKNTLPHIFYSFSGLNHCITSVLGKQVPKRNFSSPYM